MNLFFFSFQKSFFHQSISMGNSNEFDFSSTWYRLQKTTQHRLNPSNRKFSSYTHLWKKKNIIESISSIFEERSDYIQNFMFISHKIKKFKIKTILLNAFIFKKTSIFWCYTKIIDCNIYRSKSTIWIHYLMLIW